MTHELKTHRQYFNEIWDRKKLFEVRFDDRNYQIGDTVRLLDYDPDTNTFSDKTIRADISYKLEGGHFGVEKGYCVLSLSQISNWRIDEFGQPNFVS